MISWTTNIDWTHSHYIPVRSFPHLCRDLVDVLFFLRFSYRVDYCQLTELCTELEVVREFLYMTMIGKESSVPHCTPLTYYIVDYKDSSSHKVNSWQIKCICLRHACNILCVFHIFGRMEGVMWILEFSQRCWWKFKSSWCAFFCLRCYNFRRFVELYCFHLQGWEM